MLMFTLLIPYQNLIFLSFTRLSRSKLIGTDYKYICIRVEVFVYSKLYF